MEAGVCAREGEAVAAGAGVAEPWWLLRWWWLRWRLEWWWRWWWELHAGVGGGGESEEAVAGDYTRTKKPSTF